MTVGANTRNNPGAGAVGRNKHPTHNTRDDILTEVEVPVNNDLPEPGDVPRNVPGRDAAQMSMTSVKRAQK